METLRKYSTWATRTLFGVLVALVFVQQYRISVQELRFREIKQAIDEWDGAGEHPSFEDEIDAAIASMPVPPEELNPTNDRGVFGSPVQDLRKEYASKYNTARKHKLAEIDHCEACGITAKQLAKRGEHLETHHVISVDRIFHEKLDHKLIYDPANLIVLDRPHHFTIGHDPDGPEGPQHPSWKVSNPHVRRDAEENLKNLRSSNK